LFGINVELLNLLGNFAFEGHMIREILQFRYAAFSNWVFFGFEFLYRNAASMRDLPTIAWVRSALLLRRNGPVPGILAAGRTGRLWISLASVMRENFALKES
jgi:hypothetical protein